MSIQGDTPVWELSKENAAPLQRGRNVAVLEQALAETDETRIFKERTVDRYERLVGPSEREDYNTSSNSESTLATDDPLVHWLGYIKFHQESFPTNTHEQFLLMERCFRALSRLRRYANDVRFIRLCCQYADKTDRPHEIFKYLYQQKIGSEIAIFWIAWGYVAEKREEFAFANDVYQKGLKKKAKPIEKLQKRYQQYQRRMARHWLNATQTQDDDENPSSGSRGVLGSLSEEAFHRNDRSASRPPGSSFLSQRPTTSVLYNQENSFIDRSAVSRSTNTSTNQATGTGFAIFEEDGGGSANPLDDSIVQEDVQYRQLERERDRKKENVHNAERWNDRGAYTPAYAKSRAVPRPRSTNPPPFAVYVDEECIEQQRKEEEQRERQSNVHRRARDERTFRERDDLGVGDTLLKDPLRYVRDPSQHDLDQRVSRKQSSIPPSEVPGKRKANAGFSTRLLRHPATDEERCFEEARALARYYKLVPPSTNVNNLMVIPPESSDNMEEDDSSEGDDTSMTDSSNCVTVPKRPFGYRRKSLMVPQNRSIEIPTPRNASNASSTIEEERSASVALGDPTINTEIARNEISMMFMSSSPPHLNESVSGTINQSRGPVGLGLNQSDISELPENRSMVAIDEEKALEDHGFPIFDENDPNTKSDGFIIQNDEDEVACTYSKPSGFSIFNDAEDQQDSRKFPAGSTSDGVAFEIYTEDEQNVGRKKAALAIHDETSERPSEPKEANFSIYTDVMGVEKHEREIKTKATGVDRKSSGSPNSDTLYDSEEDDTTNLFPRDLACRTEGPSVSLSMLYDDCTATTNKRLSNFGNLARTKRRKCSTFSPELDTTLTEKFGDISIIMHADDNTEIAAASLVVNSHKAVEYGEQHKTDTKSAIHRLSSRSVPFPINRKSLQKILTTENLVCNLPSHCLPKNLRLNSKSTVAPGTGIVLGRSSASVKQELGRGAYGCVLLLESDGHSQDRMAAVKAQTPIGSLAWEFEILERLRDRLKGKLGPSSTIPFPEPRSFVSMADGALLTMQAVSDSGLNFIDLLNAYRGRNQLGLPEILALYYVSRMLNTIETLHWFGHVLHCDTKADNWVLSSSDMVEGEVIEASDIMLTDFGRAIDLEALDTKNNDPLINQLRGKASRDDMMCVAMKKDLPWSFDIDTYGLCDTAHLLLFGSHLEITHDSVTGKWGPKESLRRYHQKELWQSLFDTLLNLEGPAKLAIGSRPGSLREIRSIFEKYLKANYGKVKAELKHQSTFLPKKRPTGSPR